MSFDPSFQGTKNYIADRDGTKIGKWVTYADAAQTNPVDGTGGAPASTFAVSTDSTMRGVTNFLWTHSAANRQGEGFSYDFSIDPSDKGKVLQCSFEYLISSGTYADNDMSFWIYDVTNAVLIQPAPYLLKNSTIIEKFAFEFQSASNSSSYRLIAHVDTATATAYTIRFGNWLLGPQAKLYGSAVTDPVVYTPILSNFGNGTAALSYNRVGSRVKIKGTLIVGSSLPTGVFQFSLPSGLSADYTTNTVGFINTDAYQRVGIATGGSGAGYYTAAIARANTSMTNFQMEGATTTYTGVEASWDTTHPLTWAAGQTITIDMEVPIQGWSSSQVFSQDASSRTVIFSGYVASNEALTANVTNLPLTSSKDSHAAWTGSTYVVPVPGDYQIAATLLANATGGTIQAYVNASAAKQMMTINTTEYVSSAITLENLKAGDIVSFRSNATQTVSGVATAFISISRISGPAQIAASESVSALYTGAPPTGTLNGSLNNVTFGTKVKDSHNAMSGATYTVPVSGTYSISATVAIIGTRVLGSTDQLNILVNGSSIASNIQNAGGAIGTQYPLSSVLSYPILAGQTVTIQVATAATTPSYDSTASRAYFSIIRTGNY